MISGIQTDNNYLQRGIALLPVIIAVAVLIVLGGGGVAVYQIQKTNEPAEASILGQEIKEPDELQDQKEEPAQEPVEGDKEDIGSSPEPSTAAKPDPKVKAATTSAPVVESSATSEPSIPLIVEQEFERVFGRKPNGAESAWWKERVRKNSWSRETLRNSMIASNTSSDPRPTNTNTQLVPLQGDTKSPVSQRGDTHIYSFSDPAPPIYGPLIDYLNEEAKRRAAESEALRKAQEEESRAAAERTARCAPIYDKIMAKETELNNLSESVLQRTRGTFTTEAQRRAIENKERVELLGEYNALVREWQGCMGH